MKIQNGIQTCLLRMVLYVLMVLSGFILLFFHKKLTNIVIDEVFVLKQSSPLFKEWSNPSAPVTIKFYFFNWTNPGDFKNSSIKPKFKEIGPYIFHQKYHRVNITFYKNHTLSYKNNKTFHFQEQGTGLSMNDKITNMNVISTIAVDKARKWNFFYRRGLSVALNTMPYESIRTIDELLFNGYEDPLLKMANYLPFLNDVPDMEKFAWFYMRNGSADFEGLFTIGTGLGNTTLGTIYRWNRRNKGPYPGKCGNIQISAGELYPQNIKKDKLEFFFSDFCRKVVMEYNGTTMWKGSEAYKFVGGVSYLDNGIHLPENQCLCPRKCLRYGVVDFSVCKFGVPIYLSLPRFNKADPFFRNEIEGIEEPDDNKHGMHLIIEPRTGVLLNAKMTIQINLLAEPNPQLSKFKNIKETLFPVCWFSVETRITEQLEAGLTILLHLPIIFQVISVVLIIMGVVLCIRTLYVNKKKTQQGNNNNRNKFSHIFNDEIIPLKTEQHKVNLKGFD
ncbi:hypothetical protein HHI36_008323 [Cryptolaemus montrouzieri]|uniref:Uncharacterized protein n=1 Tax=Cryptolaemus montrouzieri TaxID=559131 RepID=A0ABD2MSN9_9CUCU